MIYTVTVNPSLDYVMYLDSLSAGELNRSNHEVLLAGGKGINVARVLHNLQIPSICLGFIAGFVGAELMQMLHDGGVLTDFLVMKDGCTRINVKAKSAGGNETEINGNGPVITEEALGKLKNQITKLTKDDILVLSGSVPSSVSKDLYGELAILAASQGAEVVLDAEKDLLYPALACQPLLIKPNLAELEKMLGRTFSTPEEIREGMADLKRKGARNVLLSMGKDGAYFLSEKDEFCRIEVPDGKVVNSVGAGDSMVAGFLGRYLRDRKNANPAECASYAAACGSACAFGEDLPSKEAADKLFAEIVCVPS